ncbi:class I SAM-dependent methyltransferase [Okeania sp.]|uniref:class I SAM-dependent methyltransferase n=1 Tax=Okeania sp. TaxID=3100323 RepID=UPI002B4AD28C|nr:class I SAM-dependent methyltransferase [Okeania sp.]MEB3339617.1 class I SAM-dependent methyltransferase [Okeania sp.]
MQNNTTNNFPDISYQEWNTELYDSKHSFVSNLALDLLELLHPQIGEKILDLGCGTGHLTYKITTRGAKVIGIDNAPIMIEEAHRYYPDIKFLVGDGINFELKETFDAVFSNAALHWIKEPKKVIHNIWRVLKPGGRFVTEFGGKGNIKTIINGIYEALDAAGYGRNKQLNPWYFPSVGEYANLLESEGFLLTFASLVDRPTKLEDGEYGLGNWIRMFASCFFVGIPEKKQNIIIDDIKDRLRPHLYKKGKWIADYKRIRIVAYKINE